MNLDDKIVNIPCIINLFKNIHPNIITFTGFICNILLPYYLLKDKKKFANILLIIRYLSDSLDGAIARKYNKTSKLGGLFDSVSDSIFSGIYIYLIIFKYTNNNIKSRIFGFIVFLINLLYFKYYNSLYYHNNIKSNPDNSFIAILQFFTRNSIFVYMGLFVFNINF